MPACVWSVCRSARGPAVTTAPGGMPGGRTTPAGKSTSGRWRSSKRGNPMAITTAILNYRRFLKRRNYQAHTMKNYMHTLKQFVVWVDVPIEAVTHKKLLAYLPAGQGAQAQDHQLPSGQPPGVLPLPHRGRAGGHGPSGETGLCPAAVPAPAPTPAG